MGVVVLDTNVLLLNPNALLAYPGEEIVLPEIILSELDKLKISRTDSETRYRGREISRVLFDLSEGKSLMDGIDLPNGGSLRIAQFDTDAPMPERFSPKNPDDRIIVTAWRLYNESKDHDVLLITNDLNMLLKAQTLGVPVKRDDPDDEKSIAKRFIVQPFQRYRAQILILAVACAIFAAAVVIAINGSTTRSEAVLPSEYRNFLSSEQADGIDALVSLQSNPSDADALHTVAKLYFSRYNEEAAAGSANTTTFANKGIQYYNRYLNIVPDDNDARCDLALLDLYTGATEDAQRNLEQVLENDSESVRGNYDMGIVQMQGAQDLGQAASYFTKTIDLCGDSEEYSSIRTSAADYLSQIEAETSELGNTSSDGVAL